VIWEPFVLALFLGLVVSAGLYFAYLWPTVEPLDEPAAVAGDSADHDDGDADRGDAKPATPQPAPDEAIPSSPS
jgi:hypothetical protein